MLLFYSNASPYSRKVRVVALEKGLSEQVEERLSNPFDNDPALIEVNPLVKVPSLVTDEGFALYDSSVICEYLDRLVLASPLLPREGAERWLVRRWEALADGMLDAAYNIVMERRRPLNEQSPLAMQRWQKALRNAVSYIEGDLHTLPAGISLAQIALGAALGYLDFRSADFDWRKAHPSLTDWFSVFNERPSMIKTRPE